MLNSEYWKKGYGYECANYMVNYLFDELKMNKIIADCDVKNIGSINLLKKLGMKEEGILKQHRLNKKSNSFYDVAVFGLLSQDT